MDNLILVYYISINGIRTEDIQRYMEEVSTKISAKSIKVAEIIFIPVQGETRIECINPKYITDEELIREHRLKMDILNENLNSNIKSIKKEKE